MSDSAQRRGIVRLPIVDFHTVLSIGALTIQTSVMAAVVAGGMLTLTPLKDPLWHSLEKSF